MAEDVPVRFNLSADICEAYYVEPCTRAHNHWHSHYILILYSGEPMTHVLNGQEIPVSKGDLFILSPYDFHYNIPPESGNGAYYALKFHSDSLSVLSSLFSKVEFPLHTRLTEAEFSLITQIFRNLISECVSPKVFSREYMIASIDYLLALVLRSSYFCQVPPHADASQSEAIRPVLSFIFNHFREQISISDISNEIGYTPNYLSKLFKNHTGMTCHDYIRQFRLSFASRLLKEGKLSVTNICFESGFNSLSYFSTAFRHEYGVSPYEYMKLHKSTDSVETNREPTPPQQTVTKEKKSENSFYRS